mgnify:CR=1 FL=1
MKIRVILNVNSGRKLLPYLDKDFLEIAKIGHIVSIEKVSDLKSINEALQDIDKYDLLICAGGDGTASICANYSIKYQIPLYVLPIKPHFLFNTEQEFNRLVIDYLDQHYNTENGN